MKTKAAACLSALALCLCLIPILPACQYKDRRPSRFLIPDGYVGWVKVYFKVKDAAPLPIEDGYYLFKFPKSGSFNTSSEMEVGWAQDEYFYYSGDVRRKLANTGWDGGGMIWAGYSGQSGTAAPGLDPANDMASENRSFYQGLFVGTEADYKDYGRYVSEEVGPIDKIAIEQQKQKSGIP